MLVPAAAGARAGTMDVYGTRDELLYGGVKSKPASERAGRDARRKKKTSVPVVDVAQWLLDSFRPDDLVVVKMDIEGAEHELIPRLIALNATRVIDVFLWECHPAQRRTSCKVHGRTLQEAGVRLIMQEPFDFSPWRLGFSPLVHKKFHDCAKWPQLGPLMTNISLDDCKRRCVDYRDVRCDAVMHRAMGLYCTLHRSNQVDSPCRKLSARGRCKECLLGGQRCSRACMFMRD